MEELKHELEKLSKTYVDTPEKEEKILIPFIKRLLELSVKERRKLLPTIRELQWIKGKFSENRSNIVCFVCVIPFWCQEWFSKWDFFGLIKKSVVS